MTSKPLTQAIQPALAVKASRLLILVESDPERADQLSELLLIKAHRRNDSIKVLTYRTTEGAKRSIRARKPFAVSINPRVKSIRRNTVDEWNGLEILTTTSELHIPALLHTNATRKQVERHLRERKIGVKPDFIINGDLYVAWADTVLNCLLHPPRTSQ